MLRKSINKLLLFMGAASLLTACAKETETIQRSYEINASGDIILPVDKNNVLPGDTTSKQTLASVKLPLPV